MKSVMVLFHSQEHGNTGAMAEAVAEGARAAGADVTLVNTHERHVDVEAYRRCDAAAFGSPDYFSYIAGGLKVFLDDWYIARGADPKGLTGKPYGLFYSHGGGGAVCQVMERLFANLGSKVGETIGSRGRPDAKVLEACRALGRQIAAAVRS